MTRDEKAAALLQIQADMAELQRLAERMSGYLLNLEAAGMSLPSMRQTITMIAQIALGWEAGKP